MASRPVFRLTQRRRPPLRRWLRGLLTAIGFTSVFMLAAAGTSVYLLYHHFSEALPDISLLKSYQPSLITTVYAGDETPVAQFFVERRVLIPLEKIPAMLKEATLAVEDARFYSHGGIDFIGIVRAARSNVQAGEVVEGASTITQQVAKMLFLTHRKTFERKLREIILAMRMERLLSKDEILEIYLNQTYYGHGAYGVEAASNMYFGKNVGDLSLDEAALLAGLPKAPSAYSPYNAPDRALRRRAHVLRRMVEAGYLTAEEEMRVQGETLRLRPRQEVSIKAPYFTEHVRRYLEEHYGSTLLYRGGLKVYTTLDLALQEAAEVALRRGLIKNDQRRGYRGPLGHLQLSHGDQIDWERVRQLPWPEEQSPLTALTRRVKALVVAVDGRGVQVRWEGGEGIIPLEAMTWAYPPNPDIDSEKRRLRRPGETLRVGDVILTDLTESGGQGKKTLLALAQEPIVQGALVALEPYTGYLRALVGGYDFSRSQFNRATQAIRQPGSAFKPIIYATALQRGFSPARVMVDAPIVHEQADGRTWKPSNYDGSFWGSVTLAEALAHSRNIIAIKLLEAVGVKNVVEYAKRMGIRSPMSPTLALGLGASGLTPLELTTAYNVFASQGVRHDPVAVRWVEDAEGQVLEKHVSLGERVMSEQQAFVMTAMLQGVVQRGTATRAKVLSRPVAGKTGTTNDFIDAWFVGYSPTLVAGVWVGIDDRESLGNRETGGRAALPIWIEFMQQALERMPLQDFITPPHIRMVRIHPRTGAGGDPGAGATIQVALTEETTPRLAQDRNVPNLERVGGTNARAPSRWRDLGLSGYRPPVEPETPMLSE
ncbi:MAG TPA: PBP1A family penicillin-binding protein [Candidatus Tectomicrobia bacterium]|nr:PBP1A family penicillin-binding protein [Candidatus Tectomicrobia bacterium]